MCPQAPGPWEATEAADLGFVLGEMLRATGMKNTQRHLVPGAERPVRFGHDPSTASGCCGRDPLAASWASPQLLCSGTRGVGASECGPVDRCGRRGCDHTCGPRCPQLRNGASWIPSAPSLCVPTPTHGPQRLMHGGTQSRTSSRVSGTPATSAAGGWWPSSQRVPACHSVFTNSLLPPCTGGLPEQSGRLH